MQKNFILKEITFMDVKTNVCTVSRLLTFTEIVFKCDTYEL